MEKLYTPEDMAKVFGHQSKLLDMIQMSISKKELPHDWYSDWAEQEENKERDQYAEMRGDMEDAEKDKWLDK